MLTVAGHAGGVCSCSDLHGLSGLAAGDTAIVSRQWIRMTRSMVSGARTPTQLVSVSGQSLFSSLDSPGRAVAADLETESDNYTHLSHAALTDGTYVMSECE